MLPPWRPGKRHPAVAVLSSPGKGASPRPAPPGSGGNRTGGQTLSLSAAALRVRCVCERLSLALRGSTETSRTSGSAFLWAWELVPIVPSAVGPERPPRGHRRDGQEASCSWFIFAFPGSSAVLGTEGAWRLRLCGWCGNDPPTYITGTDRVEVRGGCYLSRASALSGGNQALVLWGPSCSVLSGKRLHLSPHINSKADGFRAARRPGAVFAHLTLRAAS